MFARNGCSIRTTNKPTLISPLSTSRASWSGAKNNIAKYYSYRIEMNSVLLMIYQRKTKLTKRYACSKRTIAVAFRIQLRTLITHRPKPSSSNSSFERSDVSASMCRCRARRKNCDSLRRCNGWSTVVDVAQASSSCDVAESSHLPVSDDGVDDKRICCTNSSGKPHSLSHEQTSSKSHSTGSRKNSRSETKRCFHGCNAKSFSIDVVLLSAVSTDKERERESISCPQKTDNVTDSARTYRYHLSASCRLERRNS
jgi:hypothetical protein